MKQKTKLTESDGANTQQQAPTPPTPPSKSPTPSTSGSEYPHGREWDFIWQRFMRVL